MAHFGMEVMYILHTLSSYYGWLLYQICTKSTISCVRYHNKHIKIKKNITTITLIWHRAICYFTCVSNMWFITVPNINKINPFFQISQQINKMYEEMAIITQIWHRVKFYFACISGPWYLIMIPNMKKKSFQPSWTNVRGWTSGQTDG